MKVLLVAVNGSYSHTNLAIRCLRTPLERAGFEVALLERNLRDRTAHILQDIVAQAADIVGFSVYIWNLPLMLELAETLKTVSPKTKIVVGGPEVSFETERFDAGVCPFIDAVIAGEGEEALPAVCIALRDGRPFDRVTVASPARSVMGDEGILYRPDDYPAGSMLYYESSRGCPFHCAYCLSSASEGVRAKSVSQTEKDLLQFETLPQNVKIIKFVDRTFNYDPKRANAIWRLLLEERFTKRYHFEVCANLLNEESFALLAQFPAGKVQLEFGLQSTNEETLSAVSRHIDAAQVLSSVDRIHRMGNIHVHLDLIAGLPYETYDRFRQSFNQAYPACDLLQLGFLKLLPGTSLRRDAEKYGIGYLHNPPYTVLSTNWLSYAELVSLSRVDEVLERYREGGRFEQTLRVVFAHTVDYFGFYLGLSDWIAAHDGRRLQKISQPDAYRLLYAYACTFIPDDDRETLSRALHRDFAASEARELKL